MAIGAGPAGGDDPNHPPWGRVRGPRVLSNGSLVAGDVSTSEVMVFDSAGQFTHRFGGRGDGPGELEDFSTVLTCEGDTIIAAGLYAYNTSPPMPLPSTLAKVDGRTQTPLSVLFESGDSARSWSPTIGIGPRSRRGRRD